MNTATDLLHRIAENLRSGDVADLEDLLARTSDLLQSEDELKAQHSLINAAIEVIELSD